MVWRAILRPNVPYRLKMPQTPFRITNAALLNALEHERTLVVLKINNEDPSLICTLTKELTNQVPLNIMIRLSDRNICLSVEGQGIVHLLGNYIYSGMDSKDDFSKRE